MRKILGLLRSRAIYYWKPFNRRRMLRFYGQFVRAGDLCFDLGAHLGNRCEVWLALGARVVALESQPVCIWELQRRFGGYRHFRHLAKAIGEKPGKALRRSSPAIFTLFLNLRRIFIVLRLYQTTLS